MQLKLDELVAVKSTGLLPVFGYALAAALLIGLGFGGFVAWKWTAGAFALKENKTLRADVKTWERTAEQQRQNTVDQAAQIDAAIGRLNAISQAREHDLKAIHRLGEDLRGDLARLAIARPDLRDLDLGPDFLRHWNKANASPGAAIPAAGDAGQPAPAVPAAPAGDQREGAGDRGPARPGSADVLRLPQSQRAAEPGGGRMAGHGLAVVLRRGAEAGHRGKGLSA